MRHSLIYNTHAVILLLGYYILLLAHEHSKHSQSNHHIQIVRRLCSSKKSTHMRVGRMTFNENDRKLLRCG